MPSASAGYYHTNEKKRKNKRQGRAGQGEGRGGQVSYASKRAGVQALGRGRERDSESERLDESCFFFRPEVRGLTELVFIISRSGSQADRQAGYVSKQGRGQGQGQVTIKPRGLGAE